MQNLSDLPTSELEHYLTLAHQNMRQVNDYIRRAAEELRGRKNDKRS